MIVFDAVRQIQTTDEILQLVLSIDETIGNIVDGLILGDGEFALGGIKGIPRKKLGLLAQAVLKFAEGRQQTRAIRLDFSTFAAKAELDGVPVAFGELLDDVVRSAERGKAEKLGEVGEVLVREERNVAHEFVDDVGLGGVQGLGVVANVLGGVEGAKREAVEEVASREKASDGTDGEAGAGSQEVVDVADLRDGVS